MGEDMWGYTTSILGNDLCWDLGASGPRDERLESTQKRTA